MRRLLIAWILAAGLAATTACSDPYQQNDLELAAAFHAMMMCNCLYAMKMDEPFCAADALLFPGPAATYVIDVEHKVVESSVGLMWSDRQRFVGERYGCAFE